MNKLRLFLAVASLPFFMACSSGKKVVKKEGERPKIVLSDKQQRQFDLAFFDAQRGKLAGDIKTAKKSYRTCFALDSTNATVNFELSRIANQGENYAEALDFAERAARHAPENEYILAYLGTLYETTGQPDKMKAVYKKLYELNPENPSHALVLAQLEARTGNVRGGIEMLDKLEGQYGVNPDIIELKQEMYLKLNEVENAAKEVRKIISLEPNNVEYRGILATIYSANGMPEKAVEAYKELLEINPGEPRAHLNLAELFRQAGEEDSSMFHLRKAIASPDLDVDDKISVLVSMFRFTGRDEKMRTQAFGMLEDMEKIHPDEPKLFTLMGDFYLQAKEYKKARRAFKKAASLPGGSKFEIWQQILMLGSELQMNDSLVMDARETQELFPTQPFPYLVEGVAHLQLKKPKDALEPLEAGAMYAVDQPQMEEQFYIMLADAHNQLKNFSKSDNYFEKALKINPQNPTVLNNYAYYLAVRNENLEKALEMTERSNKLSTNNGTFLDTWGWVLFRMGRYQEAETKLLRAVRFGGADSGEVMEHLGDVYFKLGKLDEAVEAWELAKRLGDAGELIDKKIRDKQYYE